jgi:hypothetical protein
MTRRAFAGLLCFSLVVAAVALYLLSTVPDYAAVYVPAAIAMIVFRILAVKPRFSWIFKYGEYGYYAIGALGIGLFYLAEVSVATHLNTTLKRERLDRLVSGFDQQLRIREEEKEVLERRQSDRRVPQCPPQIAGATTTNVLDPSLGAAALEAATS